MPDYLPRQVQVDIAYHITKVILSEWWYTPTLNPKVNQYSSKSVTTTFALEHKRFLTCLLKLSLFVGLEEGTLPTRNTLDDIKDEASFYQS